MTAFVTDKDTVRSSSVTVTSVEVINTGGETVFTTGVKDHGFEAGWRVTISGAGEPYDGTWDILSTTTVAPEDPGYGTFTVSIASSVLLPQVSVSTAISGYAFSPAPAFVRYGAQDATLNAISSYTTLRAESWDYNTVRVSWGAVAEIEAKALDDISEGYTPRVTIVRSSFGYPSTPKDGVQILNERYVDAVPSTLRTVNISTTETQPANLSNPYNRPNSGLLAVYDRNLPSGRWYYYTIFYYLKGTDSAPAWRNGGSVDALTPVYHKHGEKLYELIPPYYRYKDQEFAPGTGRAGDLERFTRVIGMELDYTKTVADGIERLYDVDYVNDDLLVYLGEGNFGIPREGGLGDIRYRSLIAAIGRLYDERGSARGLEEMTLAATKYRCKVLEGINLMNLTDDAEFASGIGAWSDPYATHGSTVLNWEWLGGDIGGASPVFSGVTLSVVPGATSIVTRRNAMRAEPVVSGTSMGMLLACGLGSGVDIDRQHFSTTKTFTPRLHGIRCRPGRIYSFSAYSAVAPGGSAGGRVGIGIIWFNDQMNKAAFSVSGDYISKTEVTPTTTNDSLLMTRYTVSSEAPVSNQGQPFVYAVPYIVFSNNSTRYVAACMFHEQLNSVSDITANIGSPTLTLGVPVDAPVPELLGDTRFVMGA